MINIPETWGSKISVFNGLRMSAQGFGIKIATPVLGFEDLSHVATAAANCGVPVESHKESP